LLETTFDKRLRFPFNAIQNGVPMGKQLTFLALAAVLSLSGCTRRKDASVESSTVPPRTITDLRAAYAAFNRGNIEAAVQSFDPQIEWSEPAEFPGGGTYHGREAVKGYLTQSRSAWADVISEPERFITSGNRVVVFVHAWVRPKDGTKWRDTRLADVYTIQNGKAVQMRAFSDRQEALRWVAAKQPSPLN
jgi:ketosteroid isomerase-like protein